MFRLIKTILILMLIGFIGLALYAFIGPMFGADFSAPTRTIEQPLELNPE